MKKHSLLGEEGDSKWFERLNGFKNKRQNVKCNSNANIGQTLKMVIGASSQIIHTPIFCLKGKFLRNFSSYWTSHQPGCPAGL